MISEPLTINNPACVITKASGRSPILPVIGLNTTPTDADSFEITIETQRGFYPYIMRSAGMTITGLDLNHYSQDEIALKHIKPSGAEDTVPTSAEVLESTNATNTDFSTKLFFRAKQTLDKYPPQTITVETTVTIECRS